MMSRSMKALCLLIPIIAGCTMEQTPPAELKVRQAIDVSALQPCNLQSFKQTESSVLNGLHEINIQVQTPIEDVNDEILLQVDWKDGLAIGSSSKKTIQDVVLTTSQYGVQYDIKYQPVNVMSETLGVWFNWDLEKPVPITELQPNDIGNINLNPDGAIVYRIYKNWIVKQKGVAFIVCGIGGMQYASRELGDALLLEDWTVVYIHSVMTTPDIGKNIPIEGTPDSLIELFNHKYCQLTHATRAIQADLELTEEIPFVLIGISAGALNTPAIYESLPEKPECVVLIAGGANMAEIVQDGAVTNWDFIVDGRVLTNNERQQLSDAYINVFSRDPYHLASMLPHERTLIVHAKWDDIVPAKNGDLLWERAGFPERWVYPSGHLGLFATFNEHAGGVVDWIQSKIWE